MRRLIKYHFNDVDVLNTFVPPRAKVIKFAFFFIYCFSLLFFFNCFCLCDRFMAYALIRAKEGMEMENKFLALRRKLKGDDR